MIPTRRRVLASGLAGAALSALPRPARSRPVEGLEILGAPNAATIVLVRLLETGGLAAAAPNAGFRLWRDTDDLRAGLVSGRSRLITTPSHVPANLANRGMPMRLLAIISMGHLSLVSGDETIRSFQDLRGKALIGFFRNDMPDLVFRTIARREGLDPDKDMTITYTRNPSEAAQMMGAGQAATAILHEPSATAAIAMARQQGRTLRRVVSLQEMWGRHYGKPRIPMAGVALHQSLIDESPELLAALRQGLAPARDWVLANRQEAAALAEQKMGIKPGIFVASLDHFHIDVQSARAMKAELETFYGAILDLQPAALGGRLPADAFYLDL
ncbi:ABC transporter substrate-binding protein [Rhodoplanes sp. TEM]|uniref:ABC transporter substrate-binding protein n=1 Tax=Rhodoplanes tepidamans TaxID=200616 RepID=A0ABT5JCK8_RHOTP|nr:MULTISPECIES: MqnA/MqnD/SBP family protein [Rhodoplanes]MDC7787408.1 ABC transporter substrate-binding protein [Rhodoplanes tepidamans]MDC7985527.1 ABC transporter substrate-binding protein [Rhodoplanes sp. TEM]MDQ0358106.1 NitT/TauT family transport system substrate-binding protein [Rhodoplanes tepidamans]